jgi:3-oxoacyl-[acyl-carrier-protein] synthase II
MDLYINGTGLVSAAGSNTDKDFLKEPVSWQGNRLVAREPDYSGLIPPMQLRRMSKIVRMGIAAAKACLEQSGVPTADALSVGTALGGLHDTEQFLASMVTRNEQTLTPTSFIQSTHNTVGGQIAVLLGCKGHNLTFVHRGHSFEHAMMNARLYLNNHPEHTILTGGIEELTDTSLRLMQELGVYRKTDTTNATLYTDVEKGSVAGEGAGFFTVTAQPAPTPCLHLKTLHCFVARTPGAVQAGLDHFLQQMPASAQEADLVISGENGDIRFQEIYNRILQEYFPDARWCPFKHLSGEYATASAVALGMLMHAVGTGSWPEHIFGAGPSPHRIVLINNHMHHYSCWYLERI